MDPKVEEYIKKQPLPQRQICIKLRKIICDTFPTIIEEMKYGVPYYNDKYYIASLKDHVNLGFSIKNLNSEEIALFEGTGKTTRHIKIYSMDEINEKKIKDLLKLVYKKIDINNK
jgi:hypothetical protein